MISQLLISLRQEKPRFPSFSSSPETSAKTAGRRVKQPSGLPSALPAEKLVEKLPRNQQIIWLLQTEEIPQLRNSLGVQSYPPDEILPNKTSKKMIPFRTLGERNLLAMLTLYREYALNLRPNIPQSLKEPRTFQYLPPKLTYCLEEPHSGITHRPRAFPGQVSKLPNNFPPQNHYELPPPTGLTRLGRPFNPAASSINFKPLPNCAVRNLSPPPNPTSLSPQKHHQELPSPPSGTFWTLREGCYGPLRRRGRPRPLVTLPPPQDLAARSSGLLS